MNDKKTIGLPQVYIEMLEVQRQRHVRRNYQWPEVVAGNIRTRYPNILAEMNASGWWIDTLAESARVSIEVMIAVLQDGEDLAIDEHLHLSRRLSLRGKCDLTYLADDRLRMVCPATDEGKEHTKKLHELMLQADGMVLHDGRFVQRVYDALMDGKTVTYADYRWAVDSLVLNLRAHKKPGVRTARFGRLDAEDAEALGWREGKQDEG